jgi:hypothetical protein
VCGSVKIQVVGVGEVITRAKNESGAPPRLRKGWPHSNTFRDGRHDVSNNTAQSRQHVVRDDRSGMLSVVLSGRVRANVCRYGLAASLK